MICVPFSIQLLYFNYVQNCMVIIGLVGLGGGGSVGVASCSDLILTPPPNKFNKSGESLKIHAIIIRIISGKGNILGIVNVGYVFIIEGCITGAEH